MDKRFHVEAHGVRDDQCMLIPAAGSILTEAEWHCVGQAVSFKGTKRVAWRKGSCKYGTGGYIFQQARTMALNTYGMPSECIMLFDAKQRRLFWSLTNKLTEIAKSKVMQVEFNDELVRRFGSQS